MGSVRIVESKVDGFREGRTKCQRAMMRLLLTVLRRSLVRTRTSTTPVGMGSLRVGEVGAPEDGFIRYYAGARRGGFGDGLVTSWEGKCSRRRIHPLLCGGQGGEVSVMGSVRVGKVSAPEDGFIRYYAGEGDGEVSVTGCGAS